MPNESLKLYWSGYRAAYTNALKQFNKRKLEFRLLEEEYVSTNEIYLRGFESGLNAVENTLLRVINRSKKK